MSNYVTPSIDESVQRLPQQSLQQPDTQKSPMCIVTLRRSGIYDRASAESRCRTIAYLDRFVLTVPPAYGRP